MLHPLLRRLHRVSGQFERGRRNLSCITISEMTLSSSSLVSRAYNVQELVGLCQCIGTLACGLSTTPKRTKDK